MKKLLFMLMGIAATINAMAVDYTAKAVLTLEATSGYTCEMTLKQADEYGALNGAEMYMSGRKVALYALDETTPLQIAKAADFENLPLGLMCDASESYTITVSGVAGDETLVLFDLADPNDIKQYPLVNDAVINVTAAANSTINDRFIINYVPAPTPTSYTVTPNSFGYASFSAAEATVIPTTGVTVYKGAINGEVLDLSPITDYIPANTGVIVKGTAGQPYEFEVTSAAVATLSDNALKAYTDWASHSGTIYVLKDEALYRYTGSNFPANKAYLQISSANNAPKRISMRFNQPTAIDNVELEAVKAEKFIENGQILIKRGEAVYNIQGQIVK